MPVKNKTKLKPKLKLKITQPSITVGSDNTKTVPQRVTVDPREEQKVSDLWKINQGYIKTRFGWIKPKNEQVYSDTRSLELRKLDQKDAELHSKKILMDKAEQETATALGGFAERVLSPSHIVGAIVRGQSPSEYIVNGNTGLVSKEDTEMNPIASTFANLAGDFVLPVGMYRAASKAGLLGKGMYLYGKLNGKYLYDTRFKGIQSRGDMATYVPSTVKFNVQNSAEKTLNLLRNFGITDLPNVLYKYENMPLTASWMSGDGTMHIGYSAKTLHNPILFLKTYTEKPKLGFNYSTVAGHEAAHLVHPFRMKYFKYDESPILIHDKLYINWSGIHRKYPIQDLDVFLTTPTSSSFSVKPNAYFYTPNEYTDNGLFLALNVTRPNIMPGLPNTIKSQLHLKTPAEFDADLYSLKNLGHIKNGKVDEIGIQFLMLRHNLPRQGVLDTIEDLKTIGYGNSVSGEAINAKFIPKPTGSGITESPPAEKTITFGEASHPSTGLPVGGGNELEIIQAWRKAAETGDKEAGQRALDEWWKLKVPNSKIQEYLYRGTLNKNSILPLSHIDPDVGEMNGIYASPNKSYAQSYGNVSKVYMNIENPLYTEGSWTGVINNSTREDLEKLGYDGIVNSKLDNGFFDRLRNKLSPFKGRPETIVFKSNQIKLAEPFTYDDEGNLIDITKRFNFNSPDIRYGLAIPVSLTTAATIASLKNGGKLIKRKNK